MRHKESRLKFMQIERMDSVHLTVISDNPITPHILILHTLWYISSEMHVDVHFLYFLWKNKLRSLEGEFNSPFIKFILCENVANHIT